MTQNQQLSKTLPATEEIPRPGAFTIGSPHSRAAARALFNTRIKNARRMDFVLSIVGDSTRFNPPSIGAWSECQDGSMIRTSRIPWGMTLAEAERMAS